MSSTTATLPSANWLALKRKSLPNTSRTNLDDRPFKKRKISTTTSISTNNASKSLLKRGLSTVASSQRETVEQSKEESSSKSHGKAGSDPDSKENLAAMILKPTDGKERAKPTKFLALDCEMVGVGPFGLENALARVSIVNFVGDVVLDEFVLPQETVTDWRTAVSGVRKEDMANAKSFREVQAIVSGLLKDRFLVGHALQSDLSALLLSHPWQHLRDTQSFYALRQIAGSRRPALRKLVSKVFGIQIQQGEHNSIIDARAPMALYRLYRKQWESGGRVQAEPIEVTIKPPMSPASTASMPASTIVVTAPSPSPAPSRSSRSSTKSKSASSTNTDSEVAPKQTKSKQPDIIISIDKKRAKSSSKKPGTESKSTTRKKAPGKAAVVAHSKGKGGVPATPKSSRVKKSSAGQSQGNEDVNNGVQRKSWWSTLGF